MKIYDVSRLPSSIALGWDGENNWRPIAFDCSALLAGHPDATVTLWLLPKGEAQAFPVALERDGNTVTWTPLNEEMTAERGQLQIVAQDGTDVGKSRVIDYAVHDSLVGGADHPAETPSWAVQVVEDVTAQADRAEAAAESIDPESLEQTISEAIADYLEEHPVEVTETDPTVPAWAKQPEKPTYTAEDVGALPDTYTPPVESVNGKTGAVTITAEELGALTEHQSLAAYRTAAAQDTIDAAQDATIGAKYTKPSGGIPASDLADDVQTSLGKADTAYQKPSGGIPVTDLAQAVQMSLGNADSSIQNPSGGTTGQVLKKTASGVEWANESGGSAPFEIPVTRSGGTYTTTATAADILANIDNCVITFDGMVVVPFAYTRTGSFGVILAGVADSSSGYVKSENYQIIVQNDTVSIRYFEADAQSELPSGGSTGDFLRKTASGVAWQTVPSAESNSFGGGS